MIAGLKDGALPRFFLAVWDLESIFNISDDLIEIVIIVDVTKNFNSFILINVSLELIFKNQSDLSILLPWELGLDSSLEKFLNGALDLFLDDSKLLITLVPQDLITLG